MNVRRFGVAVCMGGRGRETRTVDTMFVKLVIFLSRTYESILDVLWGGFNETASIVSCSRNCSDCFVRRGRLSLMA